MTSLTPHESYTPKELKDEWETDPALWRLIMEEFSPSVDVAATADNTLCPYFYTKKEDALEQDWVADFGRTVFWMNPPFSRAGDFLVKGRAEANKGALVIALVRADGLETGWWEMGTLIYTTPPGPIRSHRGVWSEENWMESRNEIRILAPRVQYVRPGEKKPSTGVKFPSCLIIMRQYWVNNVYWWRWK